MPALEKATITIVKAGETSGKQLKVQFNPKEFSISYSQGYTNEKALLAALRGGAGATAPAPTAGASGSGKSGEQKPDGTVPTEPTPAQMSVTLYFDGSVKREDVRKKYIKPLIACMQFSKDAAGSSDADKAKAKAPSVIWTWGLSGDQFEGNITSLNTQFTKFLADGTPVGATVQLSIQGIREDIGAMGALQKAAVAIVGEKFIPQSKLGDEWKKVLANVDDPLSLRPGDALSLMNSEKLMPGPISKNLAMVTNKQIGTTGLSVGQVGTIAQNSPFKQVRTGANAFGVVNALSAKPAPAAGAAASASANGANGTTNGTNGTAGKSSVPATSSTAAQIAANAANSGFAGKPTSGNGG